jgi:phage tail-like protein
MAVGDRNDPYASFNFGVEIRGLVVGGFSEVSGLQTEVEIQDYREGGVNEYIHRRAGPVRYPANVVLKHGLTDKTELWSWYCNVVQGKIERKNMSIVLLDRSGNEKRRWNLQRAYPVKWAGPDLRALSNDVAVETVELAHDGFELQ